jgi:threonine dehydrogenase-like Zn-dependent dehydrogenase
MCGICSWDVATVKGKGNFAHPAPPGHEGVGYVRKIGPGVSGFSEGDRVTGGGFSAVRNVPVDRAYRIPDSDLPDEYWIVEPVSCAITGIDCCRLKPADRVAVVGCGFMGLLILQGLRRSYAEQLIGIDIAENRLEIAGKIGVEETYNLSSLDRTQLVNQLKSRNLDIVIDTTGAQEGLDLSCDIVRRGGMINLFGWIKGEKASFDPSRWHLGGFTIVNSSPSGKLRDPFPPAIRLMQSGVFDLEPLVTHIVDMEEYSGLMENVVKGDKTYIKGVVRLGASG